MGQNFGRQGEMISDPPLPHLLTPSPVPLNKATNGQKGGLMFQSATNIPNVCFLSDTVFWEVVIIF